MIKEIIENGVYKCFDDERLLLTITDLGNNVYRAINSFADITAEVKPIDEYKTSIKCIEYKKADKKGRYRKTSKLMEHTTNWLFYILQEKGFVRKTKCIN